MTWINLILHIHGVYSVLLVQYMKKSYDYCQWKLSKHLKKLQKNDGHLHNQETFQISFTDVKLLLYEISYPHLTVYTSVWHQRRHCHRSCPFRSKLKISCYMCNETPEQVHSRKLYWTVGHREEQEVRIEKNKVTYINIHIFIYVYIYLLYCTIYFMYTNECVHTAQLVNHFVSSEKVIGSNPVKNILLKCSTWGTVSCFE